jgi:hypothetical protein
MATQTNKNQINLTDLDFDAIKASLKTHLQAQTEFVDFDFEGAGMNIILDLLANNTHYAAFMANMLANEMFLDTAAIRNSVVSHAKHVSYTPTSPQSASALLDVQITPAQTTHSPAAISIPRNTKFTSKLGSRSYTFVTKAATTVKENSAGSYIATNLQVFEGTLREYQYVVDTTNADQKFIIPEITADTSSLAVTVQNSVNDSTVVTYTLADNITTTTSTSKVFWLQENDNGFFQVIFGDGVIGKLLEDGNLVKLEYVITNGEAANGLSTIAYSSGLATYNINNTTFSTNKIVVNTVVDIASGGAAAESTESIKFLAPRYHESQNRAVTATDYRTLITKNFPFIETVAVWGGEENDPVDLGTVYISLKPYSGTEISTTTESEITALMSTLSVVTLDTSIVDPDYIYMIPTTTVKYDQALTTKSSADIETDVFDVISDYGNNTLEKFDRDFRFSQLSTLIDNADVSVLNNLTDVNIQKRYTPTLATSEGQTLQFNNQINVSTLTSTGFTVSGTVNFFDDDGSGVVRRYSLNDDGTKTYLDSSAGTIDYVTGKVILDAITITAVNETDLTVRVTVTPSVEDVATTRNQILIVDNADITVSATADTIVV